MCILYYLLHYFGINRALILKPSVLHPMTRPGKAWWDNNPFNSKSQQRSGRVYFEALQKKKKKKNSCIRRTCTHTMCNVFSPICQGGGVLTTAPCWTVALATWMKCWHFCSDQPSSPEWLHSWPTLSSFNTAAFISESSLYLLPS